MGNLSEIIKNVKVTLDKHTPEILTGIGIAGMITTTILAVKVTPKAAKICETMSYEEEAPKKMDYVKATWKLYIPAAVTGIASVACLIGASSVNSKRTAALATAYKLSETALTEYKDKVVETFGEKKVKEIKDNIAKDKIEKNPISNNEAIVTEKGSTLCYDGIFGRYFWSDIDAIKRAVNRINREVVGQMYVSLNDFYREIDLPPTKIGDELGWNMDDGEIDIDFSSQLAKDGTPCLVIEYNVAPKYDFYKFA